MCGKSSDRLLVPWRLRFQPGAPVCLFGALIMQKNKKLQCELIVVAEELEIAKKEHLKGFVSVSKVVDMV